VESRHTEDSRYEQDVTSSDSEEECTNMAVKILTYSVNSGALNSATALQKKNGRLEVQYQGKEKNL